MRFGSFSLSLSRPPKILLSLSSSFFNLGSLGRFETEIKRAFIKLRNSKFTHSAVKSSIFPSYDLQSSRTSSQTVAGVQFLRPSCIFLFMSMFPSSPLFKLYFAWWGQNRERLPTCKARVLGRGLLAAEASCTVTGGVQEGEWSPQSPNSLFYLGFLSYNMWEWHCGYLKKKKRGIYFFFQMLTVNRIGYIYIVSEIYILKKYITILISIGYFKYFFWSLFNIFC